MRRGVREFGSRFPLIATDCRSCTLTRLAGFVFLSAYVKYIAAYKKCIINIYAINI